MVKGMDSHPDDPSLNLAGEIFSFLLFLQNYPNFEGNFLVSAKFSDRGAKPRVE